MLGKNISINGEEEFAKIFRKKKYVKLACVYSVVLSIMLVLCGVFLTVLGKAAGGTSKDGFQISSHDYTLLGIIFLIAGVILIAPSIIFGIYLHNLKKSLLMYNSANNSEVRD